MMNQPGVLSFGIDSSIDEQNSRSSNEYLNGGSGLERTNDQLSSTDSQAIAPQTPSPQVSTDDDGPILRPNVGSLYALIHDNIRDDPTFGLTYQALELGTANEYIQSNFKLDEGRLFKIMYDRRS